MLKHCRFLLIVHAVGMAVGVASGQELAAMLPFPDSMAGVFRPQSLVYCSTYNTVWVSGDGGRRVIVIDPETRERLAVLPTAREIVDACYDPVHQRIYLASEYDREVWVYDASSNAVVATIKTGVRPREIECCPAENKVYCHPLNDSLVFVIDGATNEVVDTVNTGQTLHRICYIDNRNVLYCLGWDVDVLDCTTDSIVHRFPVSHGASGLPLISPELHKLYLASERTKVIDIVRDTLLAEIWLGGGLIDAAYSPMYKKLYLSWAGYDVLEVIDCQADTFLDTVKVGGRGPYLTLCEREGEEVLVCDTYWDDCITFVDTRYDIALGVMELPSQHPGRSCWADETQLCFVSLLTSANLYAVDPLNQTLVDSLLIGGWVSKSCLNTRNGKLYSIAPRCRLISVYDAEHGTLSTTGPVGFYCLDVLYNPVDNTVWVANGNTPDDLIPDSTLTVIDCATESVVGLVRVGPSPCWLFHNPQENKVYALNDGDYTISVVDCARQLEIARFGVMRSVFAPFAYCPSLHRVYLGRQDTLYTIDGRGDTILSRTYIGMLADIQEVCYDPNRARVYIVGGSSRSFAFDCSTGTVVGEVQLIHGGFCAYDSIGDNLFVSNYTTDSPTVYRIDPGTFQLVDSTAPPQRWWTQDVAMNHANSHVYVLGLGLDRVCRVLVLETDLSLVDTVVCGGLQDRTRLVFDERSGRVYVPCAWSSEIAVIQDVPQAVGHGTHTAEPEAAVQTVVRGVLPHRGCRPGTLYDISGRTVIHLLPGDNDISHVRPGVYFVRTEDGRPRTAVRKVIIQR